MDMKYKNPCTFPIKGDISRADAIVIADLCKKRNVLEFGSGGSTIFFSIFMSKNYNLCSVENVQEWINTTKKNVSLYNEYTTCCPEFIKVDYNNNLLNNDIFNSLEYIYPSCHFDLVYIDCLTAARKDVLDKIVDRSKDGDIILLHDSRREFEADIFFDTCKKYFLKIETIEVNYKNSNINIIKIKDEMKYEPWPELEEKNNRVSPKNDDIGWLYEK